MLPSAIFFHIAHLMRQVESPPMQHSFYQIAQLQYPAGLMMAIYCYHRRAWDWECPCQIGKGQSRMLNSICWWTKTSMYACTKTARQKKILFSGSDILDDLMLRMFPRLNNGRWLLCSWVREMSTHSFVREVIAYMFLSLVCLCLRRIQSLTALSKRI